jgi:hypothetical protein
MVIMREEIDGIGGQEISMPVVQPADIGKKLAAGIRSAARWDALKTNRITTWYWP